MSRPAFSRNELLTHKSPICGIALLLTQWLRKKDCAEYFADLSQLTLGDEVWCKRLYATIVDGEKGLSPTRGMSCAHKQLGYLYQIAAAPGWLDDEDRESFAELALELAAFDLLKLKGRGARSVVCQFKGDWERVHDRPDGMRSRDVPQPSLDAVKITLLAHCFALGDAYVRGCVRAGRVEAMRLQYVTSSHTGDFWKWVWANCRTGNTSQLALLEDGIFRRGFEAYWAASRRLLPLVRALERAWATRFAVTVALDALDVLDAWEQASLATLALLPATAAGGDAVAAALRQPGAPDAPATTALLDALDDAARAARAARDASARASNDAPTLGPAADDGGAVDALEALVGAVRAARAADAGALATATLHQEGAGATRALVAAPGSPIAPFAPGGTVLGVSGAQACRLAAAAAARRLVARRPYKTAAALLAGAALADVNSPSRRNARGLLEAALDDRDAVVEAARRRVVMMLYDGDGTRFGGLPYRNTSRLIDALRSFYDEAGSERRDDIEREAKDLQALGLGDFVGDAEALTGDESIEWVAGVVPNTVQGWLNGDETLVRGFVFAGDLTTSGPRGGSYSRGSLASDISLLNAYCRLSNVNTFSGGQDVDLGRCGVDAPWLSNQLKGLVKFEKKERSRYFKPQPLYNVTRVEVRYYVARASVDAARALLTRAATATVATFRDALVKCSRTKYCGRGRDFRWKVAEVVDIAVPQLVAGAFSGVAGAFWTRDLDLGEAEARPRVLVAAVAAALGVAAADVSINVRDAADHAHVAELGRAPRISERLRAIPATGATDALAAVGAVLDAHFAPPSSSEEDEDGDAAAAAPPLLPLNGQRVFLKSFLGDHKLRLKTLVESLGGRVIDAWGRNAEVPTLAIFLNGESEACRGPMTHLRDDHRIVRERWLDGVLAGEPLPDFKPHAVYARVRDLVTPTSYFYDDQFDRGSRSMDTWSAIREDWTPAQADGNASPESALPPSRWRPGMRVVVPARAFGEEWARVNPGEYPGTISRLHEEDATGRTWIVVYEDGPHPTDEDFFEPAPPDERDPRDTI